jgi:hypothetical protein
MYTEWNHYNEQRMRRHSSHNMPEWNRYGEHAAHLIQVSTILPFAALNTVCIRSERLMNEKNTKCMTAVKAGLIKLCAFVTGSGGRCEMYIAYACSTVASELT